MSFNSKKSFLNTAVLCFCLFMFNSVFSQTWNFSSTYYTASGFNNFTFKYATGASVLQNNYEAFKAEVKFGFNEKDNSYASNSYITITRPNNELFSLDAKTIQSQLLEQSRHILEIDREEVKFIQEKVSVTLSGLLIEFLFTSKIDDLRLQESFYFLLCTDKLFTVSVRHLNEAPADLKQRVKKVTIDEIINSTNSAKIVASPSLGAKLQILPKWKYSDDGKGTVVLQPLVSGMKNFETTLSIKRIDYKKNPIAELKAHYAQKGYTLKEEKEIDYNFLLYDKKKEIRYLFEKNEGNKKIYVFYVEGKSPFNESYLLVSDGLFENVKILPLD